MCRVEDYLKTLGKDESLSLNQIKFTKEMISAKIKTLLELFTESTGFATSGIIAFRSVSSGFNITGEPEKSLFGDRYIVNLQVEL